MTPAKGRQVLKSAISYLECHADEDAITVLHEARERLEAHQKAKWEDPTIPVFYRHQPSATEPITVIGRGLAGELARAGQAKFINDYKAIRLECIEAQPPVVDQLRTQYIRLVEIISIKNQRSKIPLQGGLTRTETQPEVFFKRRTA